ncbi:MAG: sodium:solute symporter [Candidatus Aminicenantaceae bacterium]
MKNLEDFFLASRNLPAFLIFLSLSASWFGATSTLVSTDEALKLGVSSFWIVGMPTVLTVLVLAIFLARPIHRLPIISLPDLVELRYGKGVRHMASLLIIWYMIVLAASQMVAIGSFLKVFLGTPYILSLAMGTSVVLLYSIFGGFFSVVVTDSLQFFLLTVGLVSLFFFLQTSSSIAGVTELASQMGKSHYFNFFFDFKRNFLILLSFTLAWTISPIAWQRIQAARTARKAQQGLFASSAVFFLLYSLVVLIGILSLPVFPSQQITNPLLSELISSKTGILLGGILFVALVAAIMSTMDSAINTGALTLTRDIYQQIFSSSRIRGIVTVSRLSTFFVGIMAFLVATKFQNILKTLGLASEIMAEGLFIPGIAMIFLKKRLPMAGLLSLLLGGGFSILSFLSELNLFFLSLPSWPSSLPYGLALSLAGFIVGLAWEKINGVRLS